MSWTRPVWQVLMWCAALSGGVRAEANEPTTIPVESIRIWPNLAPGETSCDEGSPLAVVPTEQPPVSRVTGITCPTLDLYVPRATPIQSAILIVPGGGFARVVTNKEGSEAAEWLASIGVAAGVLKYRTAVDGQIDPWRRPLQDSQRALRVLRKRARDWDLPEDRIGIMGFSAGGQVAAMHMTQENATYQPIDAMDQESVRPSFAMLIYPWNVVQGDGIELRDEIKLTTASPPTFLVHAHDDTSSSLGSVAIYLGLKRHGVPAELHIYQNGGHGYGMRVIPNSDISTWPQRATDWLMRRNLAAAK